MNAPDFVQAVVSLPFINLIPSSSQQTLIQICRSSDIDSFRTMSDYIPQEIQFYILKHLPIKPLLRARCVCKWWKQAIDSESFSQDHLALQKPRLIINTEEPNLLIGFPSEFPQIDTMLGPRRGRRLHLVGTLHGIICLYYESENEFLIWNPWITESIRVKNRSAYNWDDHDPDSPEGHCAGFWIDPCTKEFKIIVLKLYGEFGIGMGGEDEDIYDIEIYSSSTGTWKNIPLDELEMYHTMEVTTATVVDGVGYWTAFYEYVDDDGKKMNGVVLLLFDFVKEGFLEPIHAPGMDDGWAQPMLCNRDGELSLVYMDPNKSCGIFTRKEGKWVHVFEFYLLKRVSRILWAEAEMGVIVAATERGELIFFDTRTRHFHVLKTGLKFANDFVIGHGFVESVLHLK